MQINKHMNKISLLDFKQMGLKEGYISVSTTISETGYLKFNRVTDSWWVFCPNEKDGFESSFSCTPQDIVFVDECVMDNHIEEFKQSERIISQARKMFDTLVEIESLYLNKKEVRGSLDIFENVILTSVKTVIKSIKE